ncbi:PEBP-like protein [Testicularia cyperi]|uniref:PEBP-like protein n=1 Tax=Testicularia cyperi TaxID=1882483 RepID=A0A317XPT1_9BASI|nr:PEBP-like protein [Testicularia cyperi]
MSTAASSTLSRSVARALAGRSVAGRRAAAAPSLIRSASTSSSTQEGSASTSSSSTSTSTSSTSTWKPAISAGVLPAYDEALAFLSSHAASIQEKIAGIDSDPSTSSLDAESKAALKQSLQIAAEINDPAVLAQFQRSSPTSYPSHSATFRHLRESTWRHKGSLDKLMQRATAMHVLPDVLPSITPTVDLQIAFGQGSGFTDHQQQGGDVLAGVFVDANHSVLPPTINATAFHTHEKLYTLLIVDPDSPNTENQSFSTRLHALKSNIPIKATTSHIPIDISSTATTQPDSSILEFAYLPPHPQQGTPYHRYTAILFEQQSPSSPTEPALDLETTANFNIPAFVAQRNLTPVGLHFWRSVWSDAAAPAISGVYSDILKTHEPKFTRPPRLDKVRKEIGDIGSKWF